MGSEMCIRDRSEASKGESGTKGAKSHPSGADNKAEAGFVRGNDKGYQESPVRPIIAIISIVALCYFYTLQTLGIGNPPVEINSLWVPILWFFRDRTQIHRKAGEL